MKELMIIFVLIYITPVFSVDPSFEVPAVNVTVTAGDTAMLPCRVKYLGSYQQAWTNVEDFVITHKDKRVIDDPRFSIIRIKAGDYNLHIREVKGTDEGTYVCNINTNPIKKKLVFLHINIPAKVEYFSGDVTVHERSDVTMICNATGVPPPSITWYRKTEEKSSRKSKEKLPATAGTLVLPNTTRWCEDYYECQASNGFKPVSSKTAKLTVTFPPEVYLPTPRLGQHVGTDTVLECQVTFSPQGEAYWTFRGREIISGPKYKIEIFPETRRKHLVSLVLRVIGLTGSDYGLYRCVGSNSLGISHGEMELYEYPSRDQADRPHDDGREEVGPLVPPPEREGHKDPGDDWGRYKPLTSNTLERGSTGGDRKSPRSAAISVRAQVSFVVLQSFVCLLVCKLFL